MDQFHAMQSPKSRARRQQGSYSIILAGVTLLVAATAFYWLQSLESNTFTVTVDLPHDSDFIPPTTFSVHPNMPDPYSPSTTILYEVPAATDVEIVIYNSERRTVDSFRASHDGPGRFAVTWNDPLSPNGLYFARLIGGRSDTGHVLLLK